MVVSKYFPPLYIGMRGEQKAIFPYDSSLSEIWWYTEVEQKYVFVYDVQTIKWTIHEPQNLKFFILCRTRGAWVGGG